eukprot:TRINITY_DN105542_c0_g1_i1.p1 TRINITY_DN105542_c0_g1~~TRINITY_DN105542_c0_g1_i1.p1  ORF type:complete len:511 (-),score=107.72 TRINITY_DN105542_c0_g1_i1:18-1550(-)
MEALSEYIVAAKASALPVAGVLLFLYPAALMAWTVIEGRQAVAQSLKKEQEELEQQLQCKNVIDEPLKDAEKPKQTGGRRSRSAAAIAAGVALLAVGGRIASSCFVGAGSSSHPGQFLPSLPSQVPVLAAAMPDASAAALPSLGAFAFTAAAAAGISLALKRASLTGGVRVNSTWALGRRGSGSTQCKAHFATANDAQPVSFGTFDRQISGPWTATEAPSAPQEGKGASDTAPPSLWHEVDLYVKTWLDQPTDMLRYVNEMPMGTLRKYEVQPGVPHNVIEEDVKGSAKLAKFGKPVPFNYGCFPQTYRDPDKADELYSAPGDDDPLDVIDLTDEPTQVGTVVRARVLGAVCLIDEGQADWKVLVVNVDSKSALAYATSVEEVEQIAPGRVQAVWAWLDELKRAGGKGDAKLHRKIHDTSCALNLIAEDHKSWKELVASAGSDGTARGHWIRSPLQEGVEQVRPQVLKLGWAPPSVVPGQRVRSPGMLAGVAKVSVLARAARAFSLARTQ